MFFTHDPAQAGSATLEVRPAYPCSIWQTEQTTRQRQRRVHDTPRELTSPHHTLPHVSSHFHMPPHYHGTSSCVAAHFRTSPHEHFTTCRHASPHITCCHTTMRVTTRHDGSPLVTTRHHTSPRFTTSYRTSVTSRHHASHKSPHTSTLYPTSSHRPASIDFLHRFFYFPKSWIRASTSVCPT